MNLGSFLGWMVPPLTKYVLAVESNLVTTISPTEILTNAI